MAKKEITQQEAKKALETFLQFIEQKESYQISVNIDRMIEKCSPHQKQTLWYINPYKEYIEEYINTLKTGILQTTHRVSIDVKKISLVKIVPGTGKLEVYVDSNKPSLFIDRDIDTFAYNILYDLFLRDMTFDKRLFVCYVPQRFKM